MAKKKTGTNDLDVYINGIPLGSLEFQVRKTLVFEYKEEWLKRPNSFPISRSLPLREDPFEGDKVFAYFDNLLPDNISIRQRIAARMRASSDQVFDLLAVVGRDCVGALQFIKSTEPPPLIEEAKGTPISNADIASRLKDLRMTPLAASQEDDFRLSIAGAQDKTAFLLLNNKWQIPQASTPTTHIFKPQIAELRPGLSFSDSVENEWICSRIVGAFGLPVAECKIETFEDVKVLIVTRFDRAWFKNRIFRLPQEDFCQALSVPNFKKYENEEGPGIVEIMELLNESNDRDSDRHSFMKAQVVFFLLAAIDGHAKNFSISWVGGPPGFSLTPLYDILSAQPMVDAKKFDIHKIKMAMAVGQNKHYKVNEILKRHFLETAKICKFDQEEMAQIIKDCLTELPTVVKIVNSELDSKFPQEVAKSIFSGMQNRAAALTD